MRAAYYDQVFIAPLAQPRKAVCRGSFDVITEREFSDAFRDRRFLPGWYILPGQLNARLIAALVF